MAKNLAKCFAPGCTKVGNCARGFCAKHFMDFKRACIANGSWSTKAARDEAQRRLLHPESKWTYENPAGEAELATLAERQEQQEREKQD